MKPRLLDLFCGAGGCSVGYSRAGFDVIGVDIAPQPNYPFVYYRADALMFPLDGFDAIHASPPCQSYSALRVMPNAREHADLVAPTRGRLIAAGVPYVIENVVGAPLLNPVRICGVGLGLGTDTHDLARHRLFECSFPVMVPPCAHGTRKVLGLYGDHAKDSRRHQRLGAGQFSRPDSLRFGSEAMGIDWMTWPELTQAIPPAYTEHIGGYLMAELQARAAA